MFLESSPDSQRWLFLRGDQSAYRDVLKGSQIHLFHLISDRCCATLRTALLSLAS